MGGHLAHYELLVGATQTQERVILEKIGLIGIVVFTKECLFVLFNYINYQSVIYSGNNKESLEISLVKGQGTLVLVSAY